MGCSSEVTGLPPPAWFVPTCGGGQASGVSFGQQSGPPASAKQLSYLLSLVKKAGYQGFRDARHPLGLTQRQAGGKFTGKEASELIDRLLSADATARPMPTGATGSVAPGTMPAPRRRPMRLRTQQTSLVRGMPAEVLAAELERRGWTVVAATLSLSPPSARRREPGARMT